MVERTVNGIPFQRVLKPDGKGSHWIRVDNMIKAKAGDTVKVDIEVSNIWIEPDIPADLRKSLKSVP